MKKFVARVRSVTRSQDGTVAIHMALTLASLLGMAGLATDVGLVLYQQRQMQAAADAAAFSAALALSTGNPSYETEAKAVAGQNGFVSGANGATVTVNNPPVSPAADAGNADAVQVIITQTQATLFAGVVSSGPFNISAQAVAAAIPTSSPACVLALSSSAGGVQLSGGTSISAPSCVVASQESVVVPCGDSIVAEDVYYNGAAPTVGCAGGIVGTIKKIRLRTRLRAMRGSSRPKRAQRPTNPWPRRRCRQCLRGRLAGRPSLSTGRTRPLQRRRPDVRRQVQLTRQTGP